MAASLLLISYGFPLNLRFPFVEALKASIQALEDLNKPSVEVILRKIDGLALNSGGDFDTFEALQLTERLVACASEVHHQNLTFLFFVVALQENRRRLHKSKDQFEAYFLAPFSDRE